MKKFKNKYSIKPSGESEFGLSLTVPGMALDIADAVAKLSAGQDIKTYVPMYTSESDFLDDQQIADFESMDKFERLKWSAEIRADLNEVKKRAQDLEKKKQKAKAKAALKAELEAEAQAEANAKSDGE